MDENFQWVYPPSGVPANTIGPVHLYDTIELSWTPSSLFIAPPYKLQKACLLENQTYIFSPVTNVSSPYLWFIREIFDTKPYSCWYGFMTPPGGVGGTGAEFHVVPTTAATAITFSATATSSSTSTSTSSSVVTSMSSSQTTMAAAAETTTNSAVASDAANNGLSGGAKAGIGIGVVIGVTLLIALVFGMFFFRRKSRQRQTVHEMSGQESMDERGYYKPALAFVEAEAPYPYAEVETREARLEMPA